MSLQVIDAVEGAREHPTVRIGRIGVLLVNLGTPEATDVPTVRRYLREFLSDPRVIEASPWLWKPILHGIVLTTRPPKTAAAYRAIWLSDTDESPLRHYTRNEAASLQAALDPEAGQLLVDWAMRYGAPPIADRLQALKDAGCDRILLVPLYPQYSASTTATVNDAAFDALKAMRWQPTLRIAPPFHDDPDYIEAVATGIERHLAILDWEPEILLASFHGLPKRYHLAGDPYHCHCVKTGRLLARRLGLDDRRFRLSFQSRFGREEWLRPYTDETIAGLARDQGVTRLAVVTPGFFADCVETLEEIGMQGREAFEAAGGTHFTAVPCLNDSDLAVSLLETLVTRETAGWWTRDATAARPERVAAGG